MITSSRWAATTASRCRCCGRWRGGKGPLALVHFDAHVDTWPDNFGQRYAHGSVFFHAIEEQLIDPRKVQIGIRSPVAREVFDWTVAKGVTIIAAQDVHEHGPERDRGACPHVVGDAPCLPQLRHRCARSRFRAGHGTPEIGGLAIAGKCRRSSAASELCFVGMDVVEVAPAYDVAEITALAAATMVWEYLVLAAACRRSQDRSV